MNNKNRPHRIGFTDKSPVNILERFYHNLPAWPRCMSGLGQPSWQLSKDRALWFPYIQLNKLRKAYVILTGTLGSVILANFYYKFNKPKSPGRVFKNEKEALKWLEKFR